MHCRTICIILILGGVLLNCPAFAQDSRVEQAVGAKADKVLRQMSEYLNTLEQFSLQAENSLDLPLASGQKLQLNRIVDVSVRRPDRIRADIKGDILDQQFFYDGKRITLFGKKVNYYATTKAPANIEAALDHAEHSVGLVAPAADLLYKNSYDILTADVQSGFYAGLSTVNGVECHHLAFRGVETDWQIWIENSATPFPRKFIITTKWMTGAPQFTALITKWDVSPQLEDSLFTFVAPAGAEQIEFLPRVNW